MRAKCLRDFPAWLAGLLLCVHSGVLLANQTIVLAASDSPPLHSPSMQNNGVLTEIVVAVFAKSNIDVEVRFVPWARAMESARSGAVDGMIGVWFSPERAKTLAFSDPIVTQQMVFYTHIDNPIVFTSYKNLAEQGLSLAYVRGYIFPSTLAGLNFNIRWVNQPEQYLKMLLGRRVDLMLLHEEFLRYLLRQPEYEDAEKQLVKVGGAVDVMNLHLVLSPQNAESQMQLRRFNHALKVLKVDGTIESILQRHGMNHVLQVDP